MFGLSNSPGLFGYRGVLQAQRAVLLDYRAILVTLDRFFVTERYRVVLMAYIPVLVS